MATEEAISIVARTAGVFHRPDRSQPDDFKHLRKAFIEETAKSVMSKLRVDTD